MQPQEPPPSVIDPYKRSDFKKTGEDDFDEWSPLMLERYLEEHGNMREMVRHHLDAYDYFVRVQEEETIQSFNPVFVKCDDDQIVPGKYRLELRVYMQKLKSELPKVQENDGELKLLFPSEARVRNISYCSRQTIQFRLEYTRRDEQGEEIETKTVLLPDMFFMNMFVMLRSSLCNTKVFSHLSANTVNECVIDPGGYYIVKGQEKTILNHMGKRNNVLVVLEGSASQKYSFHASIRYLQEGIHTSAKQVDMYVMARPNLIGSPVMVSTPRLRDKEFINLFVMFRALGATSDSEIMNYIFDVTSVSGEQRQAVEEYLQATIYAVPVEVVDQVSAIHYIKNLIEFDVNHFIKEEANDRRRLNQTLTMLRDEIFPQYKYPVASIVPDSSSGGSCSVGVGVTLRGCTNGRQEKMLMLGYMAKQLIWTAIGWIEPDSRDSYLNKRMNGDNVILNDLLRPNLQKVVKTMQIHMNKHLRKERKRALQNKVELDLDTLFTAAKMTKLFRSYTLQKNFDKAMQNGDFSTSGYTKRAGYCQLLKRLSMMDAIGHMRRVSTTPDKNNEEIVENRKYDPKHTGHLCLVETPDTNDVGRILQLAIGAHASLYSTPHAVARALDEMAGPTGLTKIGEIKIGARIATSRDIHRQTRLFVNGVWTAVVRKPMELFYELKRRKCTGKLHVHTSIVFDFPRNEIRVSTESGRTVRPVLRVSREDQQILLTRTQLQLLRAKQIQWSDLVTGGQLFPEGVIEYIDAEEEWFSSIAIPCKQPDRQYDYAEISYTYMQGFCAAQIPYIGMNPSARNTYMTNMGKQPVGIYVTNFDKRMDRTAYVQTFPGTPLVRNHLYTSLGLNYVPCGKQVNMCLMCYDGTNQEDSVTFNADSVDRGLFAGFLLHTEKEEDKTVVREALFQAKPDPKTTIGIKNANYDKLNRFNVINPNEIVHPNDVFLGKVVPISGVKAQIRQIGEKGVCFEDHSHIHTKTQEDGYVQSNYVGRGGDGQVLTKTTLRMFRTPSLGDKFATRQAQKVTLGRKTPAFLMPYSKISGTIPDVLYNMHCMPTRMTVGTVMEMCMGKLCVTIGAFANGSQSNRESDSPIGNLQKLLAQLNLNANVQDVMVNPQTGRVMQAEVFHGPMNVQNLKHQTIDKAHFRNIGPNVKHTRQPTEGRSRDGGSKFGEMERDVTTAVGATEILRDRLFESSDKFSMYVCKLCGLTMAGNNGQEYWSNSSKEDANTSLLFRKDFYCRLCENRSLVSLVQIPYGFKLFAQEQMSINVVPRIIT